MPKPTPIEEFPVMPAELAEPDDAPDVEGLVDWIIETAEETDEGPTQLAEDLASLWLQSDLEEGDGPHPAARWRINDPGAAEWAMRLLAAAEEEIAEHQTRSREWTEKIGRWFQQAVRRPSATRAFFELHLEDYMRRVRDASGDKTKSIPLPSGTLKSSAGTTRVVVVDDDALVGWVEANLEPEEVAEAIKVTKKPLISKLSSMMVIQAAPLGWTYELECEHVHDEVTAEPGEVLQDELPERATDFWCTTCAEQRAVVVAEPIIRKVVVDSSRRIVPGVDVSEGETSYRVQVGS